MAQKSHNPLNLKAIRGPSQILEKARSVRLFGEDLSFSLERM